MNYCFTSKYYSSCLYFFSRPILKICPVLSLHGLLGNDLRMDSRPMRSENKKIIKFIMWHKYEWSNEGRLKLIYYKQFFFHFIMNLIQPFILWRHLVWIFTLSSNFYLPNISIMIIFKKRGEPR